MNAKDAIRKVAEAISRKSNVAAVLIPRRVALSLVDEMYPFPPMFGPDSDGDVLDMAVERARSKYIRLVTQGGYIGTIMKTPMVVADDVLICPMSIDELADSAIRLGVDMAEVRRDLRRVSAA